MTGRPGAPDASPRRDGDASGEARSPAHAPGPATPPETPFARYLATAAGPGGLWRLALGLVIVALVWALTTGAALLLLSRQIADPLAPERVGSGGPVEVAFVLASFSGIWLGLALALPLLHRRPLGSLFGPRQAPSGPGLLGGAALGIGAYALSVGVAIALGATPERSDLALADWVGWLAPLALLVALQAGGEEAIFRGYLVQELGRRARHPLVWAGLPAAVFGALHYSPGLGAVEGALYALVTFLFALAAAALVWRTGGLSAAIGLHAGLNLCGIAGAGLDGVISGAQLWRFGAEDAPALFAADLVATLALLALCLGPGGRALARDQR